MAELVTPARDLSLMARSVETKRYCRYRDCVNASQTANPSADLLSDLPAPILSTDEYQQVHYSESNEEPPESLLHFFLLLRAFALL